MKKLLIVLSAVFFLFIAIPAQADWVDDIPIEKNIVFIGMNFQGANGVVTLKTKSGSCVEYKIVDNEIVKMRKCGEEWNAFTQGE
jgi:hypothetical protein